MELANILAEQNNCFEELSIWESEVELRIKNQEPRTFAKILIFFSGSKACVILLYFVYTLVAWLWPIMPDEKHIIIINPCTMEFATQLAVMSKELKTCFGDM